MDYLCVTRGGGAGGYKTIVLAPSSVQEVHDLMQLAFHLSDKYRNPAVVLSDGVVGLISETLELKTLDFEPLSEKEWAVRGRDNHDDGVRRFIDSYVAYGKIREGLWSYGEWLEHQVDKYQRITDEEVRFEEYKTEDAELILVAFGYVSRVCKEAINRAREEDLRIGLIRPITLWPFPTPVIREKADQGCKVLVVEDNLGQMLDDVKLAVAGKTDVHFLGVKSRHLPTEAGIILPGTVLEKIRSIL
jgi:2-oxoglutarate ferredoxin oxidoreductase subunit alpha